MPEIGIADKVTLDAIKMKIDTNLDAKVSSGANQSTLDTININIGSNADPASASGSLHAKLKGIKSIGWPYFDLFGDGSDGDYSPASNATLTKHLYRFRNVNIPNGVTISTLPFGVIIFAQTVNIDGLLTASGKGASGGDSTTAKAGNPGQSCDSYLGGAGGGGGYPSIADTSGGRGGSTRLANGGGSKQPGQNGNFCLLPQLNLFDFTCGAGGGSGGGSGSKQGGAGGAGGGAIIIECNQLTGGGAIRAEGIAGGSSPGAYNGGGGGGGGGGGIIIIASTISVATISASGGAGGTGSGNAQGGAGGSGSILQVVI